MRNNHRFVRCRDLRRFPVLAGAVRDAPLPIQALLIPAPLIRLVVPLAPPIGLLAAVVLSATERAAEISPICVSRMRQKANPAMAALNRTACQIRTIAQHSIERQLILTNKRVGAVVLVPIWTK
jgi:hypothetical protein